MANRFTYTLVSDGPTDRALLPIINWVLLARPELGGAEIRGELADLRNRPRESGLAARISAALEQYTCDVLFVHRDAESSDRSIWRQRQEEIDLAMRPHEIPHIRVVPIRMTEAWLLIDPAAIKMAVGNPSSRASLAMPRIQKLEDLSDPKETLHELLLQASELTGRRLQKLRGELSWRRTQIADLIDDFSPLMKVPAFAAFVNETRLVLETWANPME